MITGEGQSVSPVDGNAALAAQSDPVVTSTTTSTPTATGSLLDQQGGSTTSTTPTSTQTGSPWSLNDKGEFGEGWLDRLPEDLQDHKQTLGRFKDPAAMAKTLINQQQMLGKKADAVIVPTEKSSPEEWAAFRSKIGVPENADAYPVRPSNLPEGFEWDEAQAKQFNAFAHEKGLTPAQAEALMSWDAQRAAGQAEAQQAAAAAEFAAGKKALAELWGEKFDVEMAVTKRAVQVGGGDANSKGFGDPEVVKVINRLARLVSDDKIVNSDSTATFMAGRAKATDIQKNPDNPLHKRYMDGDPEINKLVIDLIKNG
jgi:hypothetical protein